MAYPVHFLFSLSRYARVLDSRPNRIHDAKIGSFFYNVTDCIKNFHIFTLLKD